MVARSRSGETRAFPVVETVQKDSICHVTEAPAQIDDAARREAARIAERAVATLEGGALTSAASRALTLQVSNWLVTRREVQKLLGMCKARLPACTAVRTRVGRRKANARARCTPPLQLVAANGPSVGTGRSPHASGCPTVGSQQLEPVNGAMPTMPLRSHSEVRVHPRRGRRIWRRDVSARGRGGAAERGRAAAAQQRPLLHRGLRLQPVSFSWLEHLD